MSRSGEFAGIAVCALRQQMHPVQGEHDITVGYVWSSGVLTRMLAAGFRTTKSDRYLHMLCHHVSFLLSASTRMPVFLVGPSIYTYIRRPVISRSCTE